MPQADHHAPRLDDHLKREAGPIVTAAPDGAPLDAELHARASAAEALAPATYPATARALAEVAAQADADELAAALRALPARRRFAVFGEVWDALHPPAPEPAAAAPPTRPEPEAAPPAAGRFGFAFEPLLLPFAAVVGVTPRTAAVVVDDGVLEIRFGPWVLRTDLTNVVGAEVTGPYSLAKVAGPPHLSLADRGITFATNRQRGVCIRFREPVAAALPGRLGRLLRHPAATVTVGDPDELVAVLGAGGAGTGFPGPNGW